MRRNDDQGDTFHTGNRELAVKVATTMAEERGDRYWYRVYDEARTIIHDTRKAARADKGATTTTTVKLAEKAREDILKLVEEVHNAMSTLPVTDPVVFGNKVLDILMALDDAAMAAMKPLAEALAKEQPKAAHAAAAIAALQMLGLLGPSRRG